MWPKLYLWLLTAGAFRVPQQVTEASIYQSGEAYPRCPRCRTPMDRELQAYCDRCGQALAWDGWWTEDDEELWVEFDE